MTGRPRAGSPLAGRPVSGEYVANAVAGHLHRRREQELEEQYVRGYTEHPETEEEVAEIAAWASLASELEPWQ